MRSQVGRHEHNCSYARALALATACWAAGRTDKAVTLHEQTLGTWEQTEGRHHPDSPNGVSDTRAAHP
jgi:hypothetical protein